MILAREAAPGFELFMVRRHAQARREAVAERHDHALGADRLVNGNRHQREHEGEHADGAAGAKRPHEPSVVWVG